MSDPMEDLPYEDRIAHIRLRFVDSLAERFEEIRTALKSVPEEGTRDSYVRTIHRLFHDMAGSAAMLEIEVLESAVCPAVHIAERVDAAQSELTDEEKHELDAIIEQAQAVAVQLKEQFRPT